MTQITHNLMNIQERIVLAAKRYGRNPETVRLLAVSKRHPASAVIDACRAGQTQFGENFATEAVEKQAQVLEEIGSNANNYNEISWHFIGKVQSNKAKIIARHFSWVHSLDRVKIARRLNEFRGPGQPLNVLVQINLSDDPDRAGVQPSQAAEFIDALTPFDRLRVRGLMAMAPNTDSFDEQSAAFARVRTVFEDLHASHDQLDELSMGMSGDLEAAIAQGATWVRIGTDVFGKRPNG